MKVETPLEARLFETLWRITQYMPPGTLRKRGPSLYGLDGPEAIEMAYENILEEAKRAIKGVRRPSPTPD